MLSDLQATISEQLMPFGLSVRGRAFALSAEENLFLIGSVGDGFFSSFSQSAEYKDGAADPLDRWSRRIIDGLCDMADKTYNMRAIYPFDSPSPPFQQWALASDKVSRSPLGILIHETYGLWHAYRGAVAVSAAAPPEPPPAHVSPCLSCADKPCLQACPVAAFTPDSYDVKACSTHLSGEQSQACFASACLARRACPVAPEQAYAPHVADFFMRSFQKTLRKIF